MKNILLEEEKDNNNINNNEENNESLSHDGEYTQPLNTYSKWRKESIMIFKDKLQQYAFPLEKNKENKDNMKSKKVICIPFQKCIFS